MPKIGTDLAVGGAGLGTTGSFADFPSNGSFSSAATTTTLPSSSTWLSELQTNLKFRLLFLQKLVCLVIVSYDGFPYLSTAFSTGHKLTQAIQLKEMKISQFSAATWMQFKDSFNKLDMTLYRKVWQLEKS